jgi:hypothetical protein
MSESDRKLTNNRFRDAGVRHSTDRSRRNVGEDDAGQVESAEVAFGEVDLQFSKEEVSKFKGK